jgi:hypothetical protein
MSTQPLKIGRRASNTTKTIRDLSSKNSGSPVCRLDASYNSLSAVHMTTEKWEQELELEASTSSSLFSSRSCRTVAVGARHICPDCSNDRRQIIAYV